MEGTLALVWGLEHQTAEALRVLDTVVAVLPLWPRLGRAMSNGSDEDLGVRLRRGAA